MRWSKDSPYSGASRRVPWPQIGMVGGEEVHRWIWLAARLATFTPQLPLTEARRLLKKRWTHTCPRGGIDYSPNSRARCVAWSGFLRVGLRLAGLRYSLRYGNECRAASS